MKAKSRSLIIVEYIRKCTMQTMKLIMLEAGMVLREPGTNKKYRCHIYAESEHIQLKLFACCFASLFRSLEAMQGKFCVF